MPTRPATPPGAWPRLMPAPVAAAYCGEISVEAFRRRVGSVYPRPITQRGARQRWDREALDAAITAMRGKPQTVLDAANVL